MPRHFRPKIAAQFLLPSSALLFLSLTATRPQSTQSSQGAPSAFHEDLLAEISPGAEVKQTIVSTHRLAWIEKLGDKRTVRLDGKQQGGAFEDIKYAEFSPDESHFAFFGKRASEWILVLDGQEKSSGYTRATSVAFQPDGYSIAFCACREKKCRLTVDGADTGAEFDDISYARYSPDGKHIAFFARRSKKWVAIVDGKEFGPELDDIWFPSWGFHRASGKFFFTGRLKNDWLHVIDGVSTPGFEVISLPAFSRDGAHYAYSGANAKGGLKKQKIFGSIVLDGQTVASYEGKGMIGEWSALGGSREIMLGGVRSLSTDFHGVSAPEFNPDGKLVYAARRDKGDVAVFVGSDAGPGFDEVLTPVVFTEDSQHFAYVARQAGDFVEVRDNKPVRTVASGKHGATGVGWMAVSRDASHLAFETVSGGTQFKAAHTTRALRSAVLDGQSGPEYNALALRNFDFDADARHFSYEVIGADGDRDLVNVDGHESRLYDSVGGNRYLPDSKSIQFIARDNFRFLRVTYPLGPTSPLAPVSTASAILP
jgi:hypothetical protein